ncbi:unnamed protein product [Nippostrongylus brasiliensis]|uniref:Uncharacterized protein n=1 Tax=Nippostrongylus brasiliensis TaxID=27835 RepID=A0A158QYX8_NIPBR|nr:unnamed protein product [Nippostrongylus brasiliensis]
MEDAHQSFQECAGSTALALTLEANENPFVEFLKGREDKARLCTDRLLSDSMDFEALQRLVYEDSRECFQHLPKSRHTYRNMSRDCKWEPAPVAQLTEEELPTCLETLQKERKRCETFLECCPDHIRCGERMNAVSMAYQHAKMKAEELVERLLLCIGSLEPQTVLEIAGMRVDRLRFRTPGLPFYKPDRNTEERITRRLSLMSYAALDQKKDRFIRRFQTAREKLMDEKALRIPQSTAISSETSPITSEQRVAIVRNLFKDAKESDLAVYASLIAEGNFARLAELEKEKNTAAVGGSMKHIRDATLLSKDQKAIDFLIPSAVMETARREQAQQLLLEQLPVVVTTATPIKSNKLQRSVKSKDTRMDRKSSQKFNSLTHELRTTAAAADGDQKSLKTNDNNKKIPLDKSKTVSVSPAKPRPTTQSTSIVVHKEGNHKNKELLTDDLEGSAIEPSSAVTPPMERSDESSEDGNTLDENSSLLSEDDAERSQPKSEFKEEVKTAGGKTSKPVKTNKKGTHKSRKQQKKVDEKLSVVQKEKLGRSSGGLNSENVEETELDGEHVDSERTSEETTEASTEDEAADDTVAVKTKHGVSVAKGEKSEASAKREITQEDEIKHQLSTKGEKKTHQLEGVSGDLQKRIHEESRRARTCVRFASCVETIRDYEDQCELRFSRDYLTHGIEDNDVLRLLNGSSLSGGSLPHRACLRSVKHLLVTQRSLRKTCLELGFDRSRMTSDEIVRCEKSLPSTEPIDNFLYKNHYRSEQNRLICHAHLTDLKQMCNSLAGCCTLAIKSCDEQLKASPLQERLNEISERLIRQHRDCEKTMMDTLKIFRNLETRRKRASVASETGRNYAILITRDRP